MRDAVEADAEGIMRVHLDCIHKVCGPHYTPKQVESWAKRQSLQRYISFLQQRNEFVVVLPNSDCHGNVMAFGHMGKEIKGKFSAWVDFELYGFYVSPDNLRQGIGKVLYSELERRAAIEQGGSGIGVVSTLNAVPFYEACGFEVVGVYFHGDLQLESRIMEKRLLKP